MGKFLHRGDVLILVEPFQEFLCKDGDILSLYPRIKEDRQQFMIREGRRSLMKKPFPGTVNHGRILYAAGRRQASGVPYHKGGTADLRSDAAPQPG
ncbi:hypothetical protein AGMMS49587_17540 [Spirochaetia bacterium]|nr:hypothetical protein AGMMS49587_17540 [Spirochaetia bacterium]